MKVIINQFIITLAPIEEVRLRVIGGLRIYTWLLDCISRVDSNLAMKLHGTKNSLITITPPRLVNGVYKGSINVVGDELAQIVSKAILRNGIDISLEPQQLRILLIKPERFEISIDNTLPVKEFEITFETPCLLRHGNSWHEFPYPKPLIKSIMRYLSGIGAIDPNIAREVVLLARNGLLKVSKVIQFKNVDIHIHDEESGVKVKALGFKGVIRYKVEKCDKFLAKIIDYAFQVSELLHIGSKKTWGFGKIRYRRIKVS